MEPQQQEANKPDYMTGDVATGLARLRKKLLDLSKHNRLLNFRYYKRSTLRVVDELPDQLFENLLNGSCFIFDPVRSPKNAQEKLSFWGEHRGLLDAPEKLENLKNEREIPKIPVEAFARWIGISTNYELPTPVADDRPEKHQDKYIQTLLFPENLEATCARISSLSRTAIEETGSNMLFLSFGFLEWSESTSSEKTYLAPLLLLPVQLERQNKSRDGIFRYELSYSGEDLQPNLSLLEKLKQDFGLDLPDVDSENELPERYWAKVGKIIKEKAGWRVRRQVSLSILQFGKLLLYLDLDPGNWPREENITAHSIVQKFFVGSDNGGLDFAPEYEVDEVEQDKATLPFITEADSSQHSAIIDAIDGRNLVIEGPPGTGKSQTITNLIGCALERGKKVLFVAEKLAALEVVRRRLNQAGLGDFTLELHSNKTQRRALLNDLENRLKKHGQYQAPLEIDRTLRALIEKRDELKRHAAFMHETIAEIEGTPYALLHRAARYEREVLDSCPELRSIAQELDEEFSIEKYAKRSEALKILIRSLSAITKESDQVEEFPWYGIFRDDLRARDKTEIVEDLQTAFAYSRVAKTRWPISARSSKPMSKGIRSALHS